MTGTYDLSHSEGSVPETAVPKDSTNKAGNLLQDVGYQDPRAAKGRLAVANLWISHDISSKRVLFH